MLSYHLHLSPLTETWLFKKRPWLQFVIFYHILWSVNTVAQMLVHHRQQKCATKVMALSSRPQNTIIFSNGGTVVVVWGYGYFGATNIPGPPKASDWLWLKFCHEMIHILFLCFHDFFIFSHASNVSQPVHNFGPA